MQSEFSYNLKRLRKQARLTQEELAVKTGVSIPTIRNYESGRSCPSKEIVERLSASLNVSSNILLAKAIFRYTEEDFKHFSDLLSDTQDDPYAVRLLILEYIYLIDTNLLIEFVEQLMSIVILLKSDEVSGNDLLIRFFNQVTAISLLIRADDLENRVRE